MADVKMTKKEMFAEIMSVVESASISAEKRAQYIEFLNHEVTLLANRKSSMSKVQKENVSIENLVCEVLKDYGKALTVTEMLTDSRLSGYTNQKISALLRNLKEAGRVIKTVDHKKSYFSVAE